jgi:hypothetical protein
MQMKKPFINQKDSAAFMRCFASEVNERLKAAQNAFISASNIQSFNHGIQWQSHNSSNPDDVSTMQNIRNEISIDKSDLISYNIAALETTITGLTDSMASSFAREMYATVEKACEVNGQTVDGKGKSFGENFLEILEKIEFGVDRDGNPVMPSIHIHPDGYKALRDDPTMHDPDIMRRVDELTKRKQREAIERERLRLARYKVNHD